MLTLLAFIFVLGVLILVHEFGHFIIAKKIGVRVEKFSLGFGPKVVGFRKGETEYVISAFPLGGFVKMAGENMENEENKLTGEPWEYASRSVSERIRIVICGPLMNILLAFLLTVFVFLLGREIPDYLAKEPIVGWVEEDTAGSRAGFMVNDKVISVDKEPVEDWESLLISLASDGNKSHRILVERGKDNIILNLTVESTDKGDMEVIGIYPPVPPRVGGVNKDYPAERAGIHAGDEITAVNGQPIFHWFQLSKIIQKNYGQELKLTVKRNYGPIDIKVTPMRDTLKTGIGIIGIQSAQKFTLRKYPFFIAVKHSFSEVGKQLKLTLEFFSNLFTGHASPKSIGGPIAIAQVAGSAAESGFSSLLYFMAFLSMQLGVLNLLPIPILDGGVIAFLIIEKIMGRPLSLRKREIAQQIGLTLILMLMVFAFYNDIMRVFFG